MITAHVPSSERWMASEPGMLTTSVNRNLLQPTKANKKRRESNIQKEIEEDKRQASSSTGKKSRAATRAPVINGLIREESSSSSKSAKSGRSQLVDLMVEDKAAESAERVRARKEGGAAWNVDETKHFV